MSIFFLGKPADAPSKFGAPYFQTNHLAVQDGCFPLLGSKQHEDSAYSIGKTGEATIRIKRECQIRNFWFIFMALFRPTCPRNGIRSAPNVFNTLQDCPTAGFQWKWIFGNYFYPMDLDIFFSETCWRQYSYSKTVARCWNAGGWFWNGTFQYARTLARPLKLPTFGAFLQFEEFFNSQRRNDCWYLKNLNFPNLVWIFHFQRHITVDNRAK